MDNLNVNHHQRNGIVKLKSFAHNKLSLPRLVCMFKYAWLKCGFTEEKPATLQNPDDFCFTTNGTECHECKKFNL